MAPDLEKKRVYRRSNCIITDSEQYEQDGMQLLQRCTDSFIADYYRHGSNAVPATRNTAAAAAAAAAAGAAASTAVSAPSTVTGPSLRSSAASSTSTNNVNTSQQHTTASNLLNAIKTRSGRVCQQPQTKSFRGSNEQLQSVNQQQTSLTATRSSSLGTLTSSSSSSSSSNNNNNNNNTTSKGTNNHCNNNATQEHSVCDNSNDSGLGFEERHQQQLNKAAAWNALNEDIHKRRKMDIKLESEDANFAFPESEPKITTRNGILGSARTTNVNGSVGRVVGVTRPRPHLSVLAKRAPPPHQGPITLTSQLSSMSRNGKVQLQICCQPEQQHRARYQTEGSRGAVKDRTGNGFPIVRLLGYDKPTTLQVFIGTDLGRVAPHMFYQACRVSGKNSTPCVERKIDGTIVIEVDVDPAKDMMVTCDCVGILKERNVDVEHRFPQEAGILQGRSKKKSTRCRMVFRTIITHDDGTNETLQVCSQPIVCTQPPGIPEICKKSLTSCPCTGGLELFILGKNFLKDTRVVFQLDNEDLNSSLEPHWECTVLPDKEFLQQTHLVCVVPPYRRQDLALSEAINIKLYTISSGKKSEPHAFVYTAASAPPAPSVGKLESSALSTSNGELVLNPKMTSSSLVVPSNVTSNALLPVATATTAASGQARYLSPIQPPSTATSSSVVSPGDLKSDPSPPPVAAAANAGAPVMMWSAQSAIGQATSQATNSADVMMPPPNLVASNALMNRRSSAAGMQLIIPDNLKTEVLDENSQSSLMGDNSLNGMSNSATVPSPLEQLVSENSRDSTQNSLIKASVSANNGSPVEELLGVVDLIRNQHPMNVLPQPSTFNGLHDASPVKILSPRHINKDSSSIMTSEAAITSPGVVDLRMKHHPAEFQGIGNSGLGSFAATPADQPLPAQSGHSIEKYLNQIETASKKTDAQDANYVRASIIANGQQQASNLLSPVAPLDNLVNSAAESHQLGVSPLRPTNASPNNMVSHVSAIVEDAMSSPQQTSSPPVKNMIIDMMPQANVSPLTVDPIVSNAVTSVAVSVQEPTPNDVLNTINAGLMPIQEPPIVTMATNVSPNVSVSSCNAMQVSSEVVPNVATAMQALASQNPVDMQQVQQVVEAQQQVEQVVAQAHQQAVQTVQHAQQTVVQQVVQHAQVVQQAVQKVQAVQQAPTAPAVQQAVQQATQEVVQQAVQQATQEVVQQVQAVQQAVQQAQAAQVMQQAVQNDLDSMLNQPASFVADASSALAATPEPSQQMLTTAAEQAITSVITNATQDIINNKPIQTTTAHAIIATKNILNSVATQSAQLMNSAMEGILPKSPAQQQTIVEQVASKSPPTSSLTVPTSNGMSPVLNTQTPMQQNNELPPQPTQQVPQQQMVRKTQANGMTTQDIITDHELLSYIDCFDPQNGFLM